MKVIPETLKEELAREFTQEQIEEGFKRFEGIIRVRDRKEDNQTVLNELGIEVDNKLNHPYTEKNCAIGKIGSTGEVDYCMGGCYLNSFSRNEGK